MKKKTAHGFNQRTISLKIVMIFEFYEQKYVEKI